MEKKTKFWNFQIQQKTRYLKKKKGNLFVTIFRF